MKIRKVLTFRNLTLEPARLQIRGSKCGDCIVKKSICPSKTVKIDYPGYPIDICFKNPVNPCLSIREKSFQATRSHDFTIAPGFSNRQDYDLGSNSGSQLTALKFEFNFGNLTCDKISTTIDIFRNKMTEPRVRESERSENSSEELLAKINSSGSDGVVLSDEQLKAINSHVDCGGTVLIQVTARDTWYGNDHFDSIISAGGTCRDNDQKFITYDTSGKNKIPIGSGEQIVYMNFLKGKSYSGQIALDTHPVDCY